MPQRERDETQESEREHGASSRGRLRPKHAALTLIATSSRSYQAAIRSLSSRDGQGVSISSELLSEQA